MKLTWHGHACFRLECEDGIVVFDPFEDGSVPGLNNLDLQAHLVLCSHEHHDHNARHTTSLIGGNHSIHYSSIPSFHDDKQGTLRGNNLIHVIETEHQKIVHLGDLGHIPADLEAIQHCDVLMIPVGGHYTIDAKTAKQIIDLIEPRIVIPMHYRTEDFGFDVISHLDDFTNLCKEITYHPTNTLIITPSTPKQIAVLHYQ